MLFQLNPRLLFKGNFNEVIMICFFSDLRDCYLSWYDNTFRFTKGVSLRGVLVKGMEEDKYICLVYPT